jgi:WD40 repeat protein
MAGSRNPVGYTLAIVIALCTHAPANDVALVLVQTISLSGVDGRIDHMAADANAMRLYVAALGNNTIEVIDLAMGRRIHSIAGLQKPTGIRVLPGSHQIVAASGDDGKCRIFAADAKLLGSVNDLPDADNVRLDPSSKRAYVGYADGALALVDVSTIRKVADIKLDGHPEAFQLENKGRRILVNVPSAKHIAVVDREQRTIIARWPLPGAADNFPMALDEPHHRLFVGCRTPAKLMVFDTDTGRPIAALDCCGDTDDLFYDAVRKAIYLTGGEGCVSVFSQRDADGYVPLRKIKTAPGARTSLFVPELSRLYVAVPHRGDRQAEIQVYQAGTR